jgi:hypothetical protein
MSVRRFLILSVLGLGLGLVAITWRPSNSRPESSVAADTEAARSTSLTPRAAPAELAAGVSDGPATPTPNHAEELLEDEEASFAPPTETDPDRIELLIVAGFTTDRAAEIVHRESELRVAAAYAEYAASGTVHPLTGAARTASATKLRAELGDTDYERYLAALGQPTSVVIGSIDPASAAANAGFLPGDEVVAYAGQRVFNARDLTALTEQRQPGETVAATVVRDGQALQLYVAGGPLGLIPAPR